MVDTAPGGVLVLLLYALWIACAAALNTVVTELCLDRLTAAGLSCEANFDGHGFIARLEIVRR